MLINDPLHSISSLTEEDEKKKKLIEKYKLGNKIAKEKRGEFHQNLLTHLKTCSNPLKLADADITAEKIESYLTNLNIKNQGNPNRKDNAKPINYGKIGGIFLLVVVLIGLGWYGIKKFSDENRKN